MLRAPDGCYWPCCSSRDPLNGCSPWAILPEVDYLLGAHLGSAARAAFLADLSEGAIATAFVHCRPGGAALFAPDHVRETFTMATSHGGCDDEARGLRYLEWTWDPDPSDTTYFVDYAYLLRERDGSVRAVHDRHVEGLFSRVEWLRWLAAAGFDAQPALEPGGYEVFVARRRT